MGEVRSGVESWLDDQALRFDQAWKSGSRPRIEDYLAGLAEPRRGLLLEELVRVELQRRRGMGEDLGPAEYRRRFPDDASVIDAAFSPITADWPGVQSPPKDAPQSTLEGPGTVITGRYRLLEKIGEGGMGTVWVADQTQPVRRKVALKLIKPGMDSRQVLARFEAERQALALPQHRQGPGRRPHRGGAAVLRHGLCQGDTNHRVLRHRPAERARAVGIVCIGVPGGPACSPKGRPSS